MKGAVDRPMRSAAATRRRISEGLLTLAAITATACAATACIGQMDGDEAIVRMPDAASGPAPRGNQMPARTDMEPSSSPSSSMPQEEPPLPALRRLNRAELAASIEALFGVRLAPSVLPPDHLSGRFDRDLGHFSIDTAIVNSYFDVAIEVARAVNPSGVSQCNSPITRACVQSYLERSLPLLLRRPVNDAEVESYLMTFDRGARRKDAGEGVREVVARVILSPDFLYVREASSSEDVTLAAHALATRLAFALWRAPPDSALLEQARAGANAQELIETVLTDTRAQTGLLAFHDQWLDIASARKADLRTGAPAGLGAALEDSMRAWVTHAYQTDRPLPELLAGRGLFVRPPITELLSLPTTNGSTPIEKRAGLLLHPGFLAAHAHTNETAPILRGAFITDRIACVALAQPDLDFSSLAVDPTLKTTRARAEQQTRPATCAGCHAIINPPGFAFEGYDHLGRPRATDEGVPVNTRGTFAGLGVEGSFNDAAEMLDLLLPSPVAANCFARAWLEYLLARPLSETSNHDRSLLNSAERSIARATGVLGFLREAMALQAVNSLRVQ